MTLVDERGAFLLDFNLENCTRAVKARPCRGRQASRVGESGLPKGMMLISRPADLLIPIWQWRGGTISTEGTIQRLRSALGPTCEKAGVGIRRWDDGVGSPTRGRRRPPIPAVADGQFRRRNSGPLTDRAAHLTTTTFDSTDGRAVEQCNAPTR